MTRLFIPGCALAAASLVALGGCELLKHNEEALKIINGRIVGKPAGDFFDRYGRASTRRESVDGGTSYDWMSAIAYAPPGQEGLDERICKLRLSADRQGRISAVQIVYDGEGMKSTSRCGEIFAAK